MLWEADIDELQKDFHPSGAAFGAGRSALSRINRECPEVGTVSQGNSIEEAVDNLREATELYIEETAYAPRSRSLVTTFEAVANA